MPKSAVNVVAIELLAAAQGCDFHTPMTSSAPLERVLARLRECVPRVDQDRYVAPDIAAAADLVRSDALASAVGVSLPGIEGTDA
jgi:histidine ammonia-lyase